MILRSISRLPFVALGISLIISCNNKEKKEEQLKVKAASSARAPLKADAYIANTREIYDNLDIPGTLVANEATDIHPEVSARITGIYFKEGTYVQKGALLVKLYDADLLAQKQKLQVQIKIAEQNQNRTEQLLKIGGISRQDYENAELTTSNARADLEVINTDIRKTEIRAPFSGKLGLRMVSVGAYVNPSVTVTTISQMDQMRIDFTVPEKYTREVNIGRLVHFKVESNTKDYTARVIATESNISQNTRTLQVRAAVQGDPKGLVPGGFAKVALNFQPDPNSIVVPTQAVIPEARGKKVYLYQNGLAKYVDVTTGLRDSAGVQITSGLKAGDTVLITGLLSLKPGAKVKIGKVVNGNKSTEAVKPENETNATEPGK